MKFPRLNLEELFEKYSSRHCMTFQNLFLGLGGELKMENVHRGVEMLFNS